MDLRGFIRDIPDFPQPGIVFKDITPLFLDARALEHTVALLGRYAEELDVDYVVSAEARGFVLGGAIAARAGAGFIPARKPGKLPAETSSVSYALERRLLELLAPDEDARAARLERRVVGPYRLAAGADEDLRPRLRARVLHARDRRPPARQVERISNELPDVVGRRAHGPRARDNRHHSSS